MRWNRSPWFWSVAAHLALLLALGTYWATRPPAPTAGIPAAATGGEVPVGAGPGTMANQAERRIAQAVAAAAALAPEQRWSDALAYAERLEQIGSAQSMAEIGGTFGAAMSFSRRAFVPAAKPPAGRFDVNSQLPYSVTRGPDAAGRPAKWLTWVDKDGRAKREELTPQHPMSQSTAIAALERLEASPTLRSLKDNVLLQVIDRLLDGPK